MGKTNPKSDNKPSVNPADLPVEIAMLFERASYGAVRVPKEGEGFLTEAKAQNARLVFAKLKAQMSRSPQCTRQWAATISTLKFGHPLQDDGGWCFYIRPYDGLALEVARGVVGEKVPHDEFWANFE